MKQEDKSHILLRIPERISTHRLVIRNYVPEDATSLWLAVEESRESIEPWLRWPRDVRNVDTARIRIRYLQAEWILRDRLVWGLFNKEDQQLLGEIGLVHPDWSVVSFQVSYWLRKSAQGHGYMREALRAITALVFETISASRVEVRVESDNLRSRKVPEALGYRLEGVLRRDHVGLDGELTDMCVYALTSEDYEDIRLGSEGQ